MTNLAGDFRDALDRIPRVLLGKDDRRVLTDAMTSAEILENLDSAPRSVVVVGCTGVGKSALVNALVGVDVSEADVIRPTTTGIVMAGSSGPAPIEHATEYVLAPLAPEGIVFVDTPAWDHDPDAVRSALAVADLVLLVVSPARYGDASTRTLLDAVSHVPAMMVVLNRVATPTDERDVLVRLVQERLNVADLIVINEHGDMGGLLPATLAYLPSESPKTRKAAVVRAAASHAGNHLASVVTGTAREIGGVRDALEEIGIPGVADRGLTVLESWLATHQVLIEHVRCEIETFDRRVVVVADSAVVDRMNAELPEWDDRPLQCHLDDWFLSAADRFRGAARVRWRRSSSERLLGQVSWKVGVNPSVTISKRAARLMGANLDSAIGNVHDQLVTILDEELRLRRGAWRALVNVCGDFQPGELAAAADAIGSR